MAMEMGYFRLSLPLQINTYDHLHMAWIVEPIYGVEYARF